DQYSARADRGPAGVDRGLAREAHRRRWARRVRRGAVAARSPVPHDGQRGDHAASGLRQRPELQKVFPRHRRRHPRVAGWQAGAGDYGLAVIVREGGRSSSSANAGSSAYADDDNIDCGESSTDYSPNNLAALLDATSARSPSVSATVSMKCPASSAFSNG